MNIKVIIADDQAPARTLLREMLKSIDGIKSIDEAADGLTLLNMVKSIKPHIVFIDIHMPALNGIEAAKLITDIDTKPYIVFVTASQDYTAEAFELYAKDYLVKPFKLQRLVQTIDIIKQEIEEKQAGKKAQSLKSKISFKIGCEEVYVYISDIIMCEKINRQLVLYTKNGRYTLYNSLEEIEKKLNNFLFFRSHKAFLINLELISNVTYLRDTAEIVLQHIDRKAYLSKLRFKDFREAVSRVNNTINI
jgi:two-component system LytT family response regulator